MEDKSEVLEALLKNKKIDLENIPIEQVFDILGYSREGLTTEDAEERLAIFGQNKIEETKDNKILKFLGFMWNPMSWVMETAAIMAIAIANGGAKPPDWQIFVGIIMLLLINSTISFIEEHNACNVSAALMARLVPRAKVLRDGSWSEQEATILVPGDIIRIKPGDIIPADARLLEGDVIMIDQSALTSEFLDVTRGPGDCVYSGSTCKEGEVEAVVIATGAHTFFKKAAYPVDSANQVGHFQKVFLEVGSFCIFLVAVAVYIEIMVMYPIQHRKYRPGIDNLLVLLIGGVPIAMPMVLSAILAIGSRRLFEQGAIMKRMPAIELMAGMDLICSERTGILTLNRVSIDRNLIEVFDKELDRYMVILLAARASRTDNENAIDTAVLQMLADPKEARTGIQEVQFLPFNPTNKLTALTYLDTEGKMYRVCKGAPEQILNLANNKSDIEQRVYAVIDKFAALAYGSLAVAFQEVPERRKESAGGPWQFIGLIPLFDPIRPDSAEAIQMARNLGVNVKIITEKKIEIVQQLQAKKHVCGIIGDGIGDIPAIKKADIGIASNYATDAARSASDIVFTEPGLKEIVYAVSRSRAIFHIMKHYTIYVVSITTHIVLGFMLLALVWQFDFPPFMVLIIAILNYGTVMTIPRDRVKPSPTPDYWKLTEILKTGFVFGNYLAMTTVVFFWAAYKTDFFPRVFGVSTLEKTGHDDIRKLASAIYLQVGTMNQALIFVTRSRSWSYVERPKLLLVMAFLISQLIATLIAVYANWSFAEIEGIGWGWAGVIWLYNIFFYIPLDVVKFFIRCALSGRASDIDNNQRITFARQKNSGKVESEFRSVPAHQTHFPEQTYFTELGRMVEEGKRRAEKSQGRRRCHK